MFVRLEIGTTRHCNSVGHCWESLLFRELYCPFFYHLLMFMPKKVPFHAVIFEFCVS